MVAAAELDAAHFQDVYTPPFLAEFLGNLLQADHAVGDTVQVLVRLAGLIVEQQYGAGAGREELLEGQDLAAVAQRILRQQSHFGQAVEHHAHRIDPVHLFHDAA
jgi:hypothetical protein